MITPMEAYATTDGKLFMDIMEAQAHQYGLDIEPKIKKYLDYGVYNSFRIFSDFQAIRDWEVAKKLKELKGELV